MTAELAATIALLSLSGIGPSRLRWLLHDAAPTEVVATLRAGRLPATTATVPPGGIPDDVRAKWPAELRAIDLDRVLERYRRAGIAICTPADHGWPFVDDPDPPILWFTRGDPALADPGRVRVAIVGTRRCTAVGRRVAFEFGAALAEAGVVVVSGLATGIDGAAHRGVLAGGGAALGIVGSGLDRVYPRAHRDLWEEVAGRGLLASEAALGASPERWRFPARNRMIAALADAVVVVESHRRGGSLLTVDEALDRSVPVLAVPGSVTNPAAAGTNRLLVDGAVPACSADDVLAVLGLDSTAPDDSDPKPTLFPPPQAPGGPPSDPVAAAVLAELVAGSAHVDDLVAATGAGLTSVLAAVERLVGGRWVTLHGSTVERVESRGPDDRHHYARRP